MAKYHISPASGRPNICRATVKCPIGGESDHYASKEAAREGYEKSMKASNVPTVRSKTIEIKEKEAAFKRDQENIEKARAILSQAPSFEDRATIKKALAVVSDNYYLKGFGEQDFSDVRDVFDMLAQAEENGSYDVDVLYEERSFI